MKSSIKVISPILLCLIFNLSYADETSELKIKVCEQQNTINALRDQMAEYMAHFDSLVKNLQEMQNKFHIATSIVSTNAAPASTMQPLGSENKPLAPIHYTVPLPIYYSYYDLNREKLFQPIQNNNNYFEQTISTFHDFYAISNQPNLLPGTIAPSSTAPMEFHRFNFQNPIGITNPTAQGFNFGTAPHL